jgi:hypothetical protein
MISQNRPAPRWSFLLPSPTRVASVANMMKTSLLLSLLAALLFASPVHAGDFHPEGANDLAKDGIWVNVDFAGMNTVTTFRAHYTQSADKVFAILSDTANMTRYHKANYYDARTLDKATFDKIVAAKPQSVEDLEKILGATRLKSDHNRVKDGKWTDYTYANFNFPWPLSNRWTVNEVKVTEDPHNDVRYHYAFTLLVGNFKSMTGYWELVQQADGSTEFRGEYRSDPGIALPHFATKLGTKMAMKREYEENKALLR